MVCTFACRLQLPAVVHVVYRPKIVYSCALINPFFRNRPFPAGLPGRHRRQLCVSAMILITASSKTQAPIDRHYPIATTPRLIAKGTELIDLLRPLGVAELAGLMHMSEKLAESTVGRIKQFRPPLTLMNSHQAMFTFQGDAYDHLTPLDYSEAELDHAQRHLRILSGLYGLLRPLDLMFPYRLEMGQKLNTAAGSTLYQFWGDTLTTLLNEDLKALTERTVINLASNEYSRAIQPAKLDGDWLTITFQQQKGDGWATIPIHTKRARGAMIHFTITHQLSAPEDLKNFRLDGYRFTPGLSTEDNWVFRQHRNE